MKINSIYVKEIGWIDSVLTGTWALGSGLPNTWERPIDKVDGGYKQDNTFYKEEFVIAIKSEKTK